MNQAVEAFRSMETLVRGIESAFGAALKSTGIA